MTNKLQFIQHITEMNAKLLKEISVKNAFKSHLKTSFLEKLNDLFVIIKASGNTSLKHHKAIGACSCNKDNKVLCFVANKTNNYFSFSTSYSELLFNKQTKIKQFLLLYFKARKNIRIQDASENF